MTHQSIQFDEHCERYGPALRQQWFFSYHIVPLPVQGWGTLKKIYDICHNINDIFRIFVKNKIMMPKSEVKCDNRISNDSMDDKYILTIIKALRKGIEFSFFSTIAEKSGFSLTEWSMILQISERTLQRYKKEKRTFDLLQSEKIMQIALLYDKGIDVFGDRDRFNSWLMTKNLALGEIQPKYLLDTTFGIALLNDELVRIEHGVLA